MKLVWSPEAIDDLIHIQHYIAKDDPGSANKVVLTIMTLLNTQLPEFPHCGREGRVTGTLELVVPGLPYIILYRVLQNTIEIIRVYHSSRRWPDNF